jgi:hypothetical protein
VILVDANILIYAHVSSFARTPWRARTAPVRSVSRGLACSPLGAVGNADNQDPAMGENRSQNTVGILGSVGDERQP